MDKFNIQSITGKKMGNFDNLTVESLARTRPEENNVESIIEIREKRREKLAVALSHQYDICSQKIFFANHLGRTDLLFSVPEADPDLPTYNSLACLVYVEKRLRDLCYDTYIINKNTIFITWVYIEVNMNEVKRVNNNANR
jgi:hypothetical protein